MTTCSGIGRRTCWTPCLPYVTSTSTYVGPMPPRQDIPVGAVDPAGELWGQFKTGTVPATYGPVEVLDESGGRITECPAVGSRVVIPGGNFGDMTITAACQEMSQYGYTQLVADTRHVTWTLRLGSGGCWVESCQSKSCVDHYMVFRNGDLLLFNPMGLRPSCPYPCHPDAKEPPRKWLNPLTNTWVINQPLD